MAVTHWWQGLQPDATSGVVVCRSNATATVTVTVNGQDFTGAADTSVRDGIVKITVTGLSQTRVPYYIDGAYAGTIRGKKTTGPWWVALGSCWVGNRADPLAARLAADYDLDAFIAMGDFPYCNEGYTAMGEAAVNVTSSIANATAIGNYYAHHRQIRAKPGITDLIHSTPLIYFPDDHEYFVDNFAPGLTWWQTAPAESQPGATGTDYTNAFAAADGAILAYATGNPTNSDAGIDSNATYTRFTIGPCEFFTSACCTYRSAPNINPDSSSKTMLGANQKAWLKTYLPASASTFKAWISGKQFWQGPGGNVDTWAYYNATYAGYQTELLEILYAARNVTGMFAIAGDQHRWSDQRAAAGELGTGYPAISCLVACPSGVDNNATGTTGYATYIKSRDNGALATPAAANENVYALLKLDSTRVTRYLLNSIRGLMPMGYIAAGSNVVQYERPRF